MITEKEFIQLLQKHSNGNCTEEEIQLIDQYLEKKNDLANTDLLPKELILTTFDKVSSAIEIHEKQQLKHVKTLHTAIKIAASVLLFLSLSFWLYHNQDTIYNIFNPLTYNSVETKAGKNVVVTLPDGSVIHLNQNSKLTYSNRFNA